MKIAIPERIQNMSKTSLINLIRYNASHNLCIKLPFLAYYRLTGIREAYELIPHLPQHSAQDINKFRENHKVYKAVAHTQKYIDFDESVRAPDVGVEPYTITNKPQRMIIDEDNMPSAKLCVQYGHTILQGGYMGSKRSLKNHVNKPWA